MTIEELRRHIGLIDEQLVTLLNTRAACAVEIGRLKREQGLAIYQPAREAEVLAFVRALTERNGGPLDAAAIGRLFERIIDEARRIEAMAHEVGGEAGCGRGDGRAGE
jgi:chorismate mutase